MHRTWPRADSDPPNVIHRKASETQCEHGNELHLFVFLLSAGGDHLTLTKCDGLRHLACRRRPSWNGLQFLPGDVMAILRQVILGVLAALLASITVAALAQPSRSAPSDAAGLRLEEFDVEQVPQLTSGVRLTFSLYGTPGAEATLQIEGARRVLSLREVQPGMYEGTYTIDVQDQIRPEARVTAVLRRGNQVAASVLEEPLQFGASAPKASAPAMAQSAPIEETASIGAAPRIGTPVPLKPAAVACADCAVVESVRAVEVGSVPGKVVVAAGGVAGAIFGDEVGRAHARHVAWVLGTLTGRKIEPDGNQRTRYDVVLRLPSGAVQTRSYDGVPPFKVGDIVGAASSY